MSIGGKKVCTRVNKEKEEAVVYGWTRLESIWGFGGGNKNVKLQRLKGC
jgi:hypothetical protein